MLKKTFPLAIDSLEEEKSEFTGPKPLYLKYPDVSEKPIKQILNDDAKQKGVIIVRT
jgi:hypothetical protein